MKSFLRRAGERLRQPKWRHGWLSAALTAGFIAICVLLNIGVGALEDEYGWRTDLSFNGYATVTEATKEQLRGLETDVELYLLYQSGSMDEQLLQVLNRYGTLSAHIAVLLTDIAKDPGILVRFQGSLTTSLEADSVIVNCPATGRYRILSYNDFFRQGYNIQNEQFEVEGLAYEKELSESIVYVSQADIPVIGLMQGHGELTEEALTNLISFFTGNNYACEPVNLMSGGSLDGVDMLLIAAPQKDLSDLEIERIAAFAQSGGSLFVVRDYTDPLDGMPNYLSLLHGYGVVPLPGIVVAGQEDSGSYYGEQTYILPYMCELDMTLPLLSGGCDVLLLPGACAFETPGEPDNSLSVGTVLKTGAHAYVRDLSDGGDSIDRRENDRMGEISLALYAHRIHSNGNVSRLFALGNSTILTDEYLYQRTYNEEFLIQVMGELLPQKTVSLDILAASAFRPALTAGGQTVGVTLIILLPTLIAAAALAVLIRRRNR